MQIISFSNVLDGGKTCKIILVFMGLIFLGIFTMGVSVCDAVDHLVNNAGITACSMLEEATDITNFRSVMVSVYYIGGSMI